MADLFDVCDIITKMADGFESEVVKCLDANKEVAVEVVREQLWAGLSGDESRLTPDYDNDPYFNEEGWWYKRNDDYKGWKASITPPTTGWRLGLPPRAYNVPNLYIDGTFYGNILATMNGDALVTYVSDPTAVDIVAKWGENILNMGATAIGYFNREFTEPWIWNYFESCGW